MNLHPSDEKALQRSQGTKETIEDTKAARVNALANALHLGLTKAVLVGAILSSTEAQQFVANALGPELDRPENQKVISENILKAESLADMMQSKIGHDEKGKFVQSIDSDAVVTEAQMSSRVRTTLADALEGKTSWEIAVPMISTLNKVTQQVNVNERVDISASQADRLNAIRANERVQMASETKQQIVKSAEEAVLFTTKRNVLAGIIQDDKNLNQLVSALKNIGIELKPEQLNEVKIVLEKTKESKDFNINQVIHTIYEGKAYQNTFNIAADLASNENQARDIAKTIQGSVSTPDTNSTGDILYSNPSKKKDIANSQGQGV